MSEAGPTFSSLRHGRLENRRLQWAIVLSLSVHLLMWGGYELGKRRGWWEHWPLLAWFHRPIKKLPPPAAPQAQEMEPQLSFLDVAQADPEPPKKAKFYSNNNSHAANPDDNKNLETPKLNGRQTDVPKTDTARRTELAKAQPQPEAKPEKEQTQPVQPQPTVKPGELDHAKPQDAQQQQEPPHPPRPRTLKEALAQQPNQVAGVQMKQDGGAHRIALRPSFDAKATLFGDYDAKFTQAVTQKWYDLLDNINYAGDRNGRVSLRFHLNYDGTITEITLVDNTVGAMYGYLCQQALTEPAPYARWPEEMRREIGGNFREITFTFYYY